MANEKTKDLKRVIGVSGLALTIVSITIGSGIFALPAIVGLQLGAFALLAYLFCAIMMAAIMLCYAEIGSRVTTTGGNYAYVEAAFGKFAGFICCWISFFGWNVLADAAIINIIADSLAVIYPIFLNAWIRGILFFLLLAFMVVINIRGTKHAVILVKIFTIIKLLPLFGIIILGIGKVEMINLQWGSLIGINSLGNTVLVLFFAFAGFESALGASGEIVNPKRTVPRGIFFGGLFVLIVYLLLQLVTQGILGSQMQSYKNAPLAAVAEKIVGSVGGILLLITAAISCFATVSADVLNTPRLLFAAAKDGLFPKFLAKVHPKFATPYWAIIIFALLIFVFSILGGFKQLAILASTSILLIYLSVILATMKLRKQKQYAAKKAFKAPGGLATPFIGITAIIWLLSSLSKWEILATLIFVAVVCVLYFAMKKMKIYLSIIIAVLVFQSAYSQVDSKSKLFREIIKMDSLLFEEGFNKCRLDIIEELVDANLEFYHDVAGVQNKEQFIKAMKENICGNSKQKPIRKLVLESMQVFELKNNGILYGVIQNASHKFYAKEENKNLYITGIAKFTHLWLLENNQWKLKTSLSFNHKPPN